MNKEEVKEAPEAKTPEKVVAEYQAAQAKDAKELGKRMSAYRDRIRTSIS
jgi:hypothetical protein